MFAVVQSGGKQYKVSVGDTIQVEKLDNAVGDKVKLDVLLVSDAVEKGYVSGVYVSFCDNANDGNLLVQAVLTEKGQAEAGAASLLKRIFHR